MRLFRSRNAKQSSPLRYSRRRRPSVPTLLLAVFIVGSAVQYYQTDRVSWVTDAFRAIEQQSQKWFSTARSTASVPAATDRSTTVARPAQQFDLSGSVTQVKDGDSLVLKSRGREYRVRLHGIDAPEWKQPHAETAKAALTRLVLYRSVDIETVTTDSYGRIVGRLYRDNQNINLEMVRNGDAWWYRRYAAADAALKNAEQSAQQQQLGLWRDPRPTPPWEWRRSH